MLHLACLLEKSPRVEQRRFGRVDSSTLVSVRGRDGREDGMIVNLSAGGCAISALGTYAVGSRIFVNITKFQSFAGKIVWARDGKVGVEFEVPLHPAVVDHIARLNP